MLIASSLTAPVHQQSSEGIRDFLPDGGVASPCLQESTKHIRVLLNDFYKIALGIGINKIWKSLQGVGDKTFWGETPNTL